MDENMQTSSADEKASEILEEGTALDRAVSDVVQAGPAEIQRSLVGQVQAQNSVHMDRSLAGAVVAGTDVTIQASATPVVVAGASVTMTSAYNEVMVVGADSRVEKSFVGVLIASQVHLGEGSRVLLNTPQAVAFGLAAGVAMALTFIAKGLRRK